MRDESGATGFEDGVKVGLGGVWRARTVMDWDEVDLGSCLRVVVRAKGRRSTKAMMDDREIYAEMVWMLKREESEAGKNNVEMELRQ